MNRRPQMVHENILVAAIQHKVLPMPVAAGMYRQPTGARMDMDSILVCTGSFGRNLDGAAGKQFLHFRLLTFLVWTIQFAVNGWRRIRLISYCLEFWPSNEWEKNLRLSIQSISVQPMCTDTGPRTCNDRQVVRFLYLRNLSTENTNRRTMISSKLTRSWSSHVTR